MASLKEIQAEYDSLRDQLNFHNDEIIKITQQIDTIKNIPGIAILEDRVVQDQEI